MPKNDTLYQRGRIWWCLVRNPNGGRSIRKSTGCIDRKAAVLEWRRLERQSVTGADSAANSITLADALDERIEERRNAGRAAGTIEMLTKKARHLNRVLDADTPLARIDAAAVDRYIATRLAEDAARTTIYKELVTLRGALKLARRRRLYPFDVEEVMPLDFAAEYKPRERALSLAEIKLVLEDLPPKRAAIVAAILALCATYPSELEDLSASDVDTKTWIARVRGTKQETRDREIPIVPLARPWMRLALKHLPLEPWGNVRRDLHACCERVSTCAACRRRGSVRRDPDCPSCARTPIVAPFSPNDLRRTLPTLLRAQGIDPQLLAPLLGHADSRMVERVYGRIAPEQLGHLLELGARKYAAATRPKRRRAG